MQQDGLEEKVGDGEVETKIITTPFVQVPLGVTEDRLIGTVDIEESMKVSRSHECKSCEVIQQPLIHVQTPMAYRG